MKALKIVTVMALAFGLSTAHAVDKAQVTADKSAVKSACAEEAKTAGCGDETVGTGLLKCFHAYKKAHKDFKPSQSCKDSIGKVKEDHKEMKAKREEKKEEMKK
jgi:hypothetical protein